MTKLFLAAIVALAFSVGAVAQEGGATTGSNTQGGSVETAPAPGAAATKETKGKKESAMKKHHGKKKKEEKKEGEAK